MSKEIIEKLYTSFQKLDHEGMRSCYHTEVRFNDPVFPNLKGPEVPAMWQMLVESLKKTGEWKLTFQILRADEMEGSCEWQAHYTFSLTGRKIHNRIHSEFKFKDGKIVQQTDTFNFYRWTRMAFGLTGLFLGWTSFFKRKIQVSVQKRLSAFTAS